MDNITYKNLTTHKKIQLLNRIEMIKLTQLHNKYITDTNQDKEKLILSFYNLSKEDLLIGIESNFNSFWDEEIRKFYSILNYELPENLFNKLIA